MTKDNLELNASMPYRIARLFFSPQPPVNATTHSNTKELFWIGLTKRFKNESNAKWIWQDRWPFTNSHVVWQSRTYLTRLGPCLLTQRSSMGCVPMFKSLCIYGRGTGIHVRIRTTKRTLQVSKYTPDHRDMCGVTMQSRDLHRYVWSLSRVNR